MRCGRSISPLIRDVVQWHCSTYMHSTEPGWQFVIALLNEYLKKSVIVWLFVVARIYRLLSGKIINISG